MFYFIFSPSLLSLSLFSHFIFFIFISSICSVSVVIVILSCIISLLLHLIRMGSAAKTFLSLLFGAVCVCVHVWFMGSHSAPRSAYDVIFRAVLFCDLFFRSFSHCLRKILMALTLKWPYMSISGTLASNDFWFAFRSRKLQRALEDQQFSRETKWIFS